LRKDKPMPSVITENLSAISFISTIQITRVDND